MLGDYARGVFDRAKQFVSVLLQQGRIALDADSENASDAPKRRRWFRWPW